MPTRTPVTVDSPAIERWRAFALTFPVIRDYAPASALVSHDTLDAWADDIGSTGARHAVAFVCDVWNPCAARRVGKFDLFRALDLWDSGQRRAFTDWVAAGCVRF